MTKDKIIKDIESYYPIDSEYPETNLIGQKLLIMAIQQTKFNWRDLPENVLKKYRELGFNEEETGEITEQLREQGFFK